MNQKIKKPSRKKLAIQEGIRLNNKEFLEKRINEHQERLDTLLKFQKELKDKLEQVANEIIFVNGKLMESKEILEELNKANEYIEGEEKSN